MLMITFRRKIFAVAGALTAAGTLALAGLTAASASPTGGSGRSGIEHFQLMSTSATSSTQSIIATGNVFTAGGVDHTGDKVDRVVFPQGTFHIRHSSGTGPQRFNPRTCLGQIRLHGTYTIFHGTGKFAGIRGHGRYRLSILFVAARTAKGTCAQNKPPATFQLIIRAQGPVRL
jgi:hypothetical protein